MIAPAHNLAIDRMEVEVLEVIGLCHDLGTARRAVDPRIAGTRIKVAVVVIDERRDIALGILFEHLSPHLKIGLDVLLRGVLIEAVFDGFEVMPMKKAARYGDIFLTVTGDIDIITEKHFMEMKDGAICANAGHFDCEVSRKDLERISDSHYEARKNIEAYILPNGNTIYLMAEGRLVNLAAGDGHPAEIMDLSFAMQALAVSYLCEHEKELRPQLYLLPRELDEKVAEIKLKSMGYEIDTLSDKQKEYLGLD